MLTPLLDLSYVDKVRVVGFQCLSFEHGIETPPAVLPVSTGRILDGVVANERGKRNLELNCEKREREREGHSELKTEVPKVHPQYYIYNHKTVPSIHMEGYTLQTYFLCSLALSVSLTVSLKACGLQTLTTCSFPNQKEVTGHLPSSWRMFRYSWRLPALVTSPMSPSL